MVNLQSDLVSMGSCSTTETIKMAGAESFTNEGLVVQESY